MTATAYQPRQRKPLAALPVVWHWAMQVTEYGPGVLVINDTAYTVGALRHQNQLYGWRLTKADGESYQLPKDFGACDCPDGVYNPRRPLGCKHRRGLREALEALVC